MALRSANSVLLLDDALDASGCVTRAGEGDADAGIAEMTGNGGRALRIGREREDRRSRSGEPWIASGLADELEHVVELRTQAQGRRQQVVLRVAPLVRAELVEHGR